MEKSKESWGKKMEGGSGELYSARGGVGFRAGAGVDPWISARVGSATATDPKPLLAH